MDGVLDALTRGKHYDNTERKSYDKDQKRRTRFS